jgi:hypothetical protein
MGCGMPGDQADASPAKDWRLEQLEAYPHQRGVAFVRKSYRQRSPQSDHDHCAACWATFATWDFIPAALHEGYATTREFVYGADYIWVCVPCFDEFREVMDWKDVTLRSMK